MTHQHRHDARHQASHPPVTTVDHVTELELAEQAGLELPEGVRTARVLVRLHGAPLGFVTVEGSLSQEAVLAHADEDLRSALARHRSQDGSGASCLQPGYWPGSEGLVSVVVATRDRPESLERALTSLLACRGSFEVIVVDNAPSDDATAQVIERLADARLRYVRMAEPGLSRARNLGASLAQGKVLAFTDDDVRVDAGWIVALDRAFTLGPDIGVVTGMVPAGELATEEQAHFEARLEWSTRCQPAEFHLPPRRTDPLFPYFDGNLGTGANLAVRTRSFAALGGFDEALGAGTPARGGADLDLLARTLLGGWVVRYEPAAVVWHVAGGDAEHLRTQMRDYGSGRSAYLTKHALTGEGAVRLTRGLGRALSRLGEPQRRAGSRAISPELVREERRGLLEGPLLYARGRRSYPPPAPSPESEPALPVLDLFADGPVPDAAAPLLVTAHGYPLGLLPQDCTDPRQQGLTLFTDALRQHQAEAPGSPCGWKLELGDRRPGATVVITTIGDQSEGLRRVVDQLLEQTYDPLQVVVVDNRPGRWSRAGCLPDSPRVQIVEERFPGISAARNAGLAAATTPIVLFLDDDVIPGPDWAGWLVAALHTTPDTVCATGLILPLEIRTRGQRLLEEWGGYAKGLHRQVHRHPCPEPPHPLYPYLPGIYGSGANVGFWAERLRSLGGYDETLGAGTPTFGGEDLAMQMDVVLRGHDLVYEPAAVIWHRHRASMSDWRRQLFRYGAGLSAAMLRRAGRSADDRREILRRVPAAVQHAISPTSRKNERRSGDYPRALVLVELIGMAYGPIALVRSRRRLRRHTGGTS